MINTDSCLLRNLVVHYVGNKQQEERLGLSKKYLELQDSNIADLLMRYFLSPFKNQEYYHFSHETDLDLNELYGLANKVFADPDSLFLQSVNAARHLYDQSLHPKIKGGEFYMVYLQDVLLDEEIVDAIGLFKSESRETYLKVAQAGENYEISAEDGININKLDKGCLIFNIDKEKGYRVCMVDTLSRAEEARYWKDDFLKIKPRDDSFHYTQNYLQLCKGFINDRMKEDFEVSRADEIDLMNKSVKFFKEHEVFDMQEFTRDIIQQPEVIDAFHDYKEKYKRENDVPIVDEFNISQNAVKSNSRIFKSILKLDKNFHVYIHGSRNNIVKGYDEEKQMNYYQLYFREEK